MKFGLDYRRITSKTGVYAYIEQDIFSTLANVLANKMPSADILSRNDDVQLAFTNISLFAQDTWKATRTLTITYGLRWEYNYAPSSPNGTLPYTVTQVDNFATMTVAPQGTPLWHPQKDDFAPRLGVAWQARPNLVFRAGAGIFYDLGYSNVSDGAGAWPYAQQKTVTNVSFPLSAADAAPPPFSTAPPVGYLAVVDPNHVLPRTYEWNASVERSLGKADVAHPHLRRSRGPEADAPGLLPRAEPQFHRRVRSDEKRRERELQRAASPVPPSLRPRPPGAALLHVVAFHRQRLLRRLLRERAARRVLGSRFLHLRHPPHLLRRGLV